MNIKRLISTILLMVICIGYMVDVSYGQSSDISAASAIVMDVKTGRILYHKNMNDKKPMASTTKIMTALLALENSNMKEIAEISKNSVGVEGSSIYLQEGEKLKMEDLLYGLMLRSGNDSAVAIANKIAGSTEKFSDMMNQRAKEMGALNTNFKNPHGLHDPEHYTTAYDLALISREALLNKDFNTIVKTKLWIAEREGFKYFYNKNKTLSEYNGGDGVKTGYTKVAGRCLVTSATRNGMQLVCVVLNAPNWFQDSYYLLNQAFDKYHPWPVIQENIPLKTVSIENGKKETTKIICKENIFIPVTDEEKNKVFTVLELKEQFSAPIHRGTQLGRAKIYVDNKLFYTAELYSREDIEVKTFFDRITDRIKRIPSKNQ